MIGVFGLLILFLEQEVGLHTDIASSKTLPTS